MAQKTLLRRLGAGGYDLGPTRLVLSFGTDARLQPAKVMRLVQEQGQPLEADPRHAPGLQLRRAGEAGSAGGGPGAAAGTRGLPRVSTAGNLRCVI